MIMRKLRAFLFGNKPTTYRNPAPRPRRKVRLGVERLETREVPAISITEFSAGINAEFGLYGVASGSDGNVWFGEGDSIGRITPQGVVTEFSDGLNAADPNVQSITNGPDGNLWFTDRTNNRVGRITPEGTITEFSDGITADAGLTGITAGADGNLWFVETVGNIGRITPQGVVTEFTVVGVPNVLSVGITAGPDGNVWFSRIDGISRITPEGVVTDFPLTGEPFQYPAPKHITTGPDGNLWFTRANDKIGRITPNGDVTEFTSGISANSVLWDIATGRDGNLWFTESNGDRISRITPTGVVTEFSAGITALSGPLEIVAGADGNLWFTEGSGIRIGRVSGMPVIGPNTLPAGTAGTAYNQTITVTGGTTPYTSLTVTGFSAGGTGLSVPTTNLANGTISVSGTPTGSGTATFTVNVIDGDTHPATKSYSVTINPAAAAVAEFVDPNPAAGNRFGDTVVVLPGGNVVVTSPFDDAGGTNAGAVYLFNGATGALISSLRGSSANDQIGVGGEGGASVITLANGNYVIVSRNWDNGAVANAGAVTFGSGISGVSGTVSVANSLVGSTANDRVGTSFGESSVTALSNGNYVVRSREWDNGAAANAGAVTFGNGTSGITGVVSAANSLVGSTADDRIGSVIPLTNGNYVLISVDWDNGAVINAGAVTFGSGTSGISGAISAANSLVGSSQGDEIGSSGVAVLPNGNYVVHSPHFRTDNGQVSEAGAVTFGNGTTGISGAVSAANSLVGSAAEDSLGATPVTVLSNGNYVVVSPNWDNGAVANVGAVIFANGTVGISGTVSAANSLIGSSEGDYIGLTGVTALVNGNYVVRSSGWQNVAAEAGGAGAVTFGNGTTGITGIVSAANSLVGTSSLDAVGQTGVTALANGNYLVRSQSWRYGAATNAGAVTFGNGTTGISGAVSAANSLVGTTTGDQVGDSGVTVLANGNYLVRSENWNNGAATDAGAVTFGNGTSGVSGPISAANSLVGTTASDRVGNTDVTVLANGNYVVRSPDWDNGAVTNVGAVTFGSGTSGISGAISAANSLVGTRSFDQVGSSGVTALVNGNYVVRSQLWDNGAVSDAGAVTFASGTAGISGAVSLANSLVGSTMNDVVGNDGVTALSNGNYVVGSGAWDNGALNDAGAVTFGNGTIGVSGAVSAANSLVGSTADDQVGDSGVTALSNGNYVALSYSWDNGALTDAGAVTFGNGTSGVTGPITSANSARGAVANADLYDVYVDNVNGTFLVLFTSESRLRVGSQVNGFATAEVQITTFGALPDREYGQQFQVSATASSGLPVSFSVVSGPASLNGNTVTITGLGPVTIRASQAGNANFLAAADVDRAFNAIQANQTINFGALASKTPSDPAFDVSATASSGLAVTFSVVSGPATISGNTVTLTGETGQVTIRASQTGNGFYNAAPDVDRVFSVGILSQLRITHGFHFVGSYYQNYYGFGEKLFQDRLNQWWGLTPQGELIRWDGISLATSRQNNLVANLDTQVFDDPTLLFNAPASLTAAEQTQLNQLQTANGFHFVGSYYQNYYGLGEKLFQDRGNQWWALTPQGELIRWDGISFSRNNLVATLSPLVFDDPTRLFNAPVSLTAAEQTQLNQLQTANGFHFVGSYYQNYYGLGEKLFQDRGNQWWALTPQGELIRWDGISFSRNNLVATLSPLVFDDPTRLFNAAASLTAAEQTQLNQLQTANGFHFAGSYYQNYYGLGEKLFKDRLNQWWALTPQGELIRWDGISFSRNNLVATLSPLVFDDPTRLFNAPVSLTAAEQTQLNQLQTANGFHFVGYYYQNYYGLGEKLFQDRQNQWWALTPLGELIRWDGISFSQNNRVATLSPLVFDDPNLLFNA